MEASADFSRTNKRKRKEPISLEAMEEAFVENREKLVEALDIMSERQNWSRVVKVNVLGNFLASDLPLCPDVRIHYPNAHAYLDPLCR
jgi:hypothetical protein